MKYHYNILSSNNEYKIKALLNSISDFDEFTENNLHHCVTHGYDVAFKLIIQDPRFTYIPAYNYLFEVAITNSQFEITKHILEDKRFKVNDQQNIGFCIAVEMCNYNIVELLLKDPRINPADDDNYSILYAIHKEYESIIKLLLKDPRVNPSADNNIAVIYASVQHNNYELTKLLLQNKNVLQKLNEKHIKQRLVQNALEELYNIKPNELQNFLSAI